MPIYNLLEYSKNYKKITGSLWNYYRDQPSNPLNTDSESFKYKAIITGSTYNVGDDDDNYDANKVGKKETEVVISLKYLSNFWRSLNMPLINCEVELILTWSKNCVLADMTVANNPPTGLEFQTKTQKLYVPVITLSKENDIKLLEQLKSRFKRNIKWNKYRSQMTAQPSDNNLNYLIDPTITNVNTLFLLSFVRSAEGVIDFLFSDYYLPNARIKDFNVLIDGKSLLNLKKNPTKKLSK